jgi:2-methylcitrate dehydratase PrpD
VNGPDRPCLKRYNAEIHSQSAIEALLELRAEHGLTGAEVQRIELTPSRSPSTSSAAARRATSSASAPRKKFHRVAANHLEARQRARIADAVKHLDELHVGELTPLLANATDLLTEPA